MAKVWTFKPCEKALVERLFQCLENVPRPLAVILAQRGCTTAEDVRGFMNPALSTLRDPFELPDMEKAVERIRRALAAGERITVFGDYDADGVCSTALMVRVLRELGGNISTYIPSRQETGYGLSPEALTACVEKNSPSLIVTVDCGTSSLEAVEAAREQGIDVVVTDHHEPGGEPADAVAVVNPKRVPDHPASILAGVGVAFKLCHALVKAGRDAGCAVSASVDLKNVLDFVAVATVTDMVPLLGENRALVRAGFQTLEDAACPGWGALKKVTGLTGPLQTWHAGFALGPRINAAGRVGRADAALELFLTDRPERAEELAQLLDEANCERQDIERGIVKEAIEEIDKTFDEIKPFGLVIAKTGWHPGVIGIVASRLVQRYHRPVAVVGIDGDSGRGSCRSIDGFSVLEGLNACSDLLNQFGGHDMAAGLEVKTENIEAFKERFNAFAAEKLKTADLRPVLEIDCAVELSELNQVLVDGLKRTGPFGQDNPEPVWALRNVNVADSRILKEKHLKLTLTDGQTRMDAIGFNMAEKLPSGPVDAAFSFHENTWNGRTSLQLTLKDIR
ncbi:MAG TPA: single-stranded-DNA-specific exonuclease RecJ, partial [Tichowtungia sp.]|nr:single-stranded-DNA-specific exonuclease RecJ [Tichowtungia sp.]